MHSELKTMLAEAKPFAPPDSKVVPLLREAEKSLPYPAHALPDTIRLAVESYQDYGQQPIEMVAMSALSIVSLACQGLANVARDRKLVGPLSLNMMVAADSGERKSSGDQTFSAAAHEWQKLKKEEMKDRIKLAESAVKTFEAQRSGLLAKITALTKRGHFSQVQDAKRQLEELELTEPTKPMQPALFYEDLTQEGLLDGLADEWPSAIIASNEGGIVVGGHSLREEKATQCFACLNLLWDGTAYRRKRSSASSYTLYGRRVSCYLMMQMWVLQRLIKMGDGQSRGTGFLARMLFAAPESTMGTRLYKKPTAHDPYLDDFNKRVYQLLNTPLPVKEGTLELQLPTLELARDAHALWESYYNEVETQIGKLGNFESIKDFAAKSAENAARIAGNFHVFTYGAYGEISADTIHRAITIARWHLNETRRIFLQMDQPDDVVLGQLLWEWIQAKGVTTVTLKEILQFGPYKLRDRNSRDIALRKLVEHGYLTETTEGAKTIYRVCTDAS